ncbi:hypothetical protein RJ639_042170 [Escallonia herrerae]|uniref:PWWP domain-containing protein n=1 Tax=Escallonia herrerae TaxID=1293975 RepID=A0AA88WFU0_9ASTE|nr:hypothetical protein RJ639_042170 [Escallonia herrerae]
MAFPLDALSHTTTTTTTTKKDEELKPQGGGEEEEPERGASVKYVPLCDLYSSTSPCGSSNIKVKARKLEGPDPKPTKPPIIRFYYRRRKRPCFAAPPPPPPLVVVKIEQEELEDLPKKKRRKIGCTELINLGADLVRLDGPRLRETPVRRNVANGHTTSNCNSNSNSRQPRSSSNAVQADNSSTKRWVSLSFNGVDPKKLIGLKRKASASPHFDYLVVWFMVFALLDADCFWPLDADWYCGCIVGYDPQIDRHHAKYEDGDEEDVKLSNERIKFSISSEEMQRLKLSYGAHCSETGGLDFDDMVVLAASLDDCHELEPGDIIWAKLTGHAVWPAIVLDESLVGNRKGLNKVSGEKSVPVQFFGTHDFARVKAKQVISFLRGLLSSNHLKCKKSDFVRSLEEAKVYFSEQRLPERMLHLRNRPQADRNSAIADTEGVGDERLWSNSDGLRRCPFEIGDLQVLSLGKIVKYSDYFQDQRSRWPQGYTAGSDPSLCSSYKMEVLRDPESKERFLFRVTADKGERGLLCSVGCDAQYMEELGV